MKKALSIMLVLVMALGLMTGCSNGTQSTETSAAQQSSKAEESAAETSAEASTEASAETSTEASAETSAESAAESSAESSAAEESATAESSTEESTAEAAESSAIAPENTETVRIAALKGPTSLGMLRMMDAAEKGEAADDYQFTLAGAADEILGDIIQGNFDIAAVPINVAAVLYNKTEGKVQLAADNALGVLYLLEAGDTIHSIADLAGKTIYTTGQGATPEYTLNYVLNANGLTPGEDVTVEYMSEAAEIGAQIAAGNCEIALAPQPYATAIQVQNEGWHVALSMNDAWNEVYQDRGLISGCIVIQKAFAEAHPEVMERFMAAYKDSVDWVNANPADAGALAEHFDITKAGIATKAIPLCNIVCISGDEMKAMTAGYLQILFDANPASVGGTMPADDFYYGAN
ncbi:MAG: ABC transporter substrate-binding protein [Firmicutes bacterium]|nr:ABC transporter substrate-binding protein [Bacillota bacterium]